jgi:nucleolar protein 15
MAPKPTANTSKKAKATPPKAAAPPADDPPAPDAPASDSDHHLRGFSTDDDDSSDSSDEDEDAAAEPSALDVRTLPTIAKDDAVVQQKLAKARRQPGDRCGVLYLARLPHGFYEAQLRAYFAQFGTVTRLRLSRNQKTGRSKHYAFLEFDSASVAQIVADTMDNYLLMGHILRCKVVPPEEVHAELWVGANRRWRVVPLDRVVRVQHNKVRTEEERRRAETRLMRRQEERKRKLEKAGIRYDFEAVAYKKAAHG